MKKFKIPVTWEMYGVYTVEAESLEDAKKKVEQEIFEAEKGLPEGHYIDDSIRLDSEEIIGNMNE